MIPDRAGAALQEQGPTKRLLRIAVNELRFDSWRSLFSQSTSSGLTTKLVTTKLDHETLTTKLTTKLSSDHET